jgi:predicted 2-oxoglutarate/Fe(II)-dependent dioxygenase YbiX
MQLNIIVPERIFTIEDFFSAAECADYIKLSEKGGYEAAAVQTLQGQEMRPDIRNNARLIWDDVELAANLWQRIQPFVPSPLWSHPAIGLNERFRFYRYDPGQTFKPHYDGSFKRENGERSQVTFMVYLNGDCVGGETKFDLPYPHGEIAVQPKEGMAILFPHSVRHEGAPVWSGRKYVLRTDVMYSAEKEEKSQI